MIHARVLTAWKEGGPPLGRSPAVHDDHRPLSWSDVTGTPAENLPCDVAALVIEGTWDATTWAAFLADPAYGPGAVLWAEGDPTAGPATRHGGQSLAALRAALAARGFKAAHLAQVLAVGDNGSTRADVGSKILHWLRARPRAVTP